MHSLGLNEAELDFLSTSLGGDLVDVKNVSSVTQALRLVLDKSVDRVLSRIHFHCLPYHIIIERAGFF